MEPWEQYQHDTAELLRELGFTAVVNDSLAEPNGTVHAVDVSARRTLAGVDLLWVVECKLWNTQAVPMEKVAALKAIVDWVGADRGLLMSETGFQSGAIRMAMQKNITLSSVADLRENAAEELLAARITAAEKRLMRLALRVNRDLRPFALQDGRMLVAFAARLRAVDVEEFTVRAAAVDYVDGLVEITSRIEGLTIDDHLTFMTHPAEMTLSWRPGIDENVMDGAAAAINYMTQALYQGRLGYWPAMCPATGTVKLAWSMRQLIEVVEPCLDGLEQKVAEQEDKAAREVKLPWPHQAQ
jgi:Restriction endonuclease